VQLASGTNSSSSISLEFHEAITLQLQLEELNRKRSSELLAHPQRGSIELPKIRTAAEDLSFKLFDGQWSPPPLALHFQRGVWCPPLLTPCACALIHTRLELVHPAQNSDLLIKDITSMPVAPVREYVHYSPAASNLPGLTCWTDLHAR